MKSFYLLFLSILFFSCQNDEIEEYDAVNESKVVVPSSIVDQEAVSDGIISKEVEQKIVKNAQISFESSNPKESIAKLIQEIESKNGYVISNSSNSYDEYTSYSLNVKVPTGDFHRILNFAESNCGLLISKNISSQDVTEEYIDNSARIKSLKELESRYLRLIQKSNKIEDLIALEEKLSEIRGYIERKEGRQRYIDNNVKFSQINIHLEDKSISAKSNFFYNLKKEFFGGIELLGNIFLALVRLLPIILLILLIIFLLKRQKISFWKTTKKNKSRKKNVKKTTT